MVSSEKKTCSICSKVFSTIYTRNRHVRRVHKQEVTSNRKCRIVCPLCQVDLGTYIILKEHLCQEHNINLTETFLTFANMQEYKYWKAEQKIRNTHAVKRHVKKKGCKEIHYVCNRSNTNGYQSNCGIRAEKAGGSIKINGFCPSRLIVKVFKRGSIKIEYQNVHVGHEDLRKPSKDSYLNRAIMKAHKKAKAMLSDTEITISVEGRYEIKSLDCEKHYTVCYNGLCENECKTLFCQICKICIHTYTCDCLEYIKKNALCKHVHLVQMFVFGNDTSSDADNIVTKNYSDVEQKQQEEIEVYETEQIVEIVCEDEGVSRQIEIELLANTLYELDQCTYSKVMNMFKEILRKETVSADPETIVEGATHFLIKQMSLV